MEKRFEVLNYLLNHNGFTTNKQLQEHFSIARRTIVNYVNQLNKESADMILSTPHGYQIADVQSARCLLNQRQDEDIPADYESRKSYVLEKLLLSEHAPTVASLAEDLYISGDTFHTFLNKFKKELAGSHLYIKSKEDHLYIIGEEAHKRKFILAILEQELQKTTFSIQSIQKFFTFVKLSDILAIVEHVLSKNAFFLDDFSKLNYVLHLGICIESKNTTRSRGIQKKTAAVQSEYSLHVLHIVEDIYTQLIQRYHFDFTLNDIIEASILMSTRIISKQNQRLSYDQLDLIVGKNIKALMLRIVESVYQTYGIRLNTNDFMIRFTLHLKNMLTRLRNYIALPNNQFITIKKDFPFLYLIASHIAFLISSQEHVQVNEHEISYIALHLGVLMEEEKTYSQKINCTLVIYDYYSLGESIFKKVCEYTNTLYLTNIVTSYDQLSLENPIDLILTTLPVNTSLDIPQVKISLVPTKKDIDSILHEVNDLQQHMSSKEVISKIKTLFRRDLFAIHTTFQNSQETLAYMSEKMIEQGYVTIDFKQAIFDHEEQVPSAYANIAIPHPLSDDSHLSHQSAIYVLINETPITWGDHLVDFVFMISLRQEDKILFHEIFDLVIKVITLPETKNRIKGCQDFQAFVDLLQEAAALAVT